MVSSMFKVSAPIVASLLGMVLLAGGAFLWFTAVRPRRVMHRFDAFYAHHPVGSAIADLVEDPFVEEITMASTGGKSVDLPDASAIKRLRADIESQTAGRLWLQWTYVPPFGRLWLDASFSGGHITAIKQGETD
jgi:hypothetical protein